MLTRFSKYAFLIFTFFISQFALTEFASAEYKVALVLDKGGKDDKSFNASAYAGAMQAKDKLKVFVKYVEATDDHSFEPLLRAFANKDFDLIVAVGIAQADAMKKVSAAFPKKHFVLIDSEVAAPNVHSLLFEEHEGSFIVGALAALKSTSGKVGFIGGMDIPLIRRFEMGYKAGAQYINPKAQVTSNYVGVTGDAWNNPARAKELAISQYKGGVDVIFAAAGASGAGLFDAAEENKKFAIGVDSNQNWIKPGYVLTSMLKKIDETLYHVIEQGTKGQFTAGTFRNGLKNNGVDYALDSNNAKLVTPEMKKKVDAIKADIITGKIKVPDYYKR